MKNEKYNCRNCDKEFGFKGHSYSHMYCDNKCQHEYQYKQRIVEWKDGGKVAGRFQLKRYLAEQKHGCWQCGITNWNDKELVLEMEHIDGNSANNSEENLSLLCPNCHSQTSTYKNRNIRNGRHSRRQRYQEGKSY